MTKSGSRRSIDAVMFLIFFSLVFVGGYLNLYGTAQDVVAKQYDRTSESLVLGRLIPDEGGSIFWWLRGVKTKSADWIGETAQYYVDDKPSLPLGEFTAYTGQVGLQGNVFAAIDRMLRFADLSAPQRLESLRALSVATLAGILAYFLILIGRDLGRSAALVGLLIIIFSPWLTVFARNLYWVPFTWFLPIVLTWRAFVWHYPANRQRLAIDSSIISIALLVKCLCGFEFITAVIGAVFAVMLYGAVRRKDTFRGIVVSGTTIVTFLTAAVVSALLSQIVLLGYFYGSLQASFADFIERATKRSYGNAAAHAAVYAESLNSSVWSVLETYWKSSPVLDVGPWFSANAFQVVTALGLIFLVACIALLAIRGIADNLRTVVATSILVVGCSAASISWFVLAKGHSYIHTQLNFVLWHLPLLIVISVVAAGLMGRIFPSLLSAPIIGLCIVASSEILVPTKVESNLKQISIATFNVSSGKISLFANGVGFELDCKRIVPGEAFFLHVFAPARFLPADRRQYGFANLDFDWESNSSGISIVSWWTGKCRAFAPTRVGELDLLPIRSIDFGQFNSAKRIWQEGVGADDLSSVANKELTVEEFSDFQWDHGFHKTRNGFFVRNTFPNRQSVAFSEGIDHDGHLMKFDEVAIGGSWINFFFEGDQVSRLTPRSKIKLYLTQRNRPIGSYK